MSAVITPTPGRVVWYWPSANDGVPSLPGQPLAAIVAAVHTDRRVNLSVIDSYGNTHARGNVSLIQPDDIRPQPGSFNFAEWMPYQITAAGIELTEQREAALNPAADPALVSDLQGGSGIFAETDGTSASETGLVTDDSVDAEPVDAEVDAK